MQTGYVPIFVAIALSLLVLACGGKDASTTTPRTATAQRLDCRGPAEVFPGQRGANIVATLLDAQGKPVAGKTVRWKASSAPGALYKPDGGPADASITNASGEAAVAYQVPFDAAWSGDVTVTAELEETPSIRCEARFKGISPGMPLPPARTPAP